MPRIQLQLPAGRPSWTQRLLLLLSSTLALLATAGLLVAGFFVAMAVLGAVLLLLTVFWLRRKISGRPSRFAARGPRAPVTIEGEYVVLQQRPRSR